MASRQIFSGLVLTLFTGAVAAACSSSSTKASDAGSGDGAIADAGGLATEDAAYVTGGLVGCSPLEPGCYVENGDYSPPAVKTTCSAPGTGVTAGARDNHCSQEDGSVNGTPPQTVSAASCSVNGDAGGGGGDSGVAPGPCGENGPDYGATMYGNEGDDDDCKYHTTWEATPICENDGVYFTVKANYQTRNAAPLTGACTFAEICLNDTHPGPNIDARPPTGNQIVVESPPGTYTIGPVQFDEPGDWTVRFHFNEICCDIADDSPHGHAAFHVKVP